MGILSNVMKGTMRDRDLDVHAGEKCFWCSRVIDEPSIYWEKEYTLLLHRHCAESFLWKLARDIYTLNVCFDPGPWWEEGTCRRKIPDRVRFSILERDEWRCRYCGIGKDDATLVIDHVIPVSQGGSNGLDNLVTACRECNSGKGARRVIQPIGTRT